MTVAERVKAHGEARARLRTKALEFARSCFGVSQDERLICSDNLEHAALAFARVDGCRCPDIGDDIIHRVGCSL